MKEKKQITPNEEHFVRMHQTEEGIFTVLERDGIFKIAVGNKIIVKNEFKSCEEAYDYIEAKPWELIINTVCLVYELSKKVNEGK